jgi:glycopeptide antibiotics resistance protein
MFLNVYIYRGGAMASCLPQSLLLFKSFVKTPHRKKTGTIFARLLKKSHATFIPVSAIFNTFQKGINLLETFQKV